MSKRLSLDSTKLPYHQERIKQWLKGERIAPITVEWALTTKCTYHCIFDNYCYSTKNRAAKREVSKKAAFNFIDDASEIGVKAIPLGSDGESTCSPFLYEVIPYAKEKGLDIALSTNGVLLREDKLEDILKHLSYLRFNFSAGESKRYAKIMGCNENCFHKVSDTIKRAVEIKKQKSLDVIIGLQMVLMPHYADQVVPFAKIGNELGVDYSIIKHCDENNMKNFKIDYEKYKEQNVLSALKEAESYSKKDYSVIVKWSKILNGGKRPYAKCYGPQFMFQISGTGDIGPCGTFHDSGDERVMIGNINDTRFKDLWKSDKYRKVMDFLASDNFDHKFCSPLCLQYKTNEFLWDLKQGKIRLEDYSSKKDLPHHINFI